METYLKNSLWLGGLGAVGGVLIGGIKTYMDTLDHSVSFLKIEIPDIDMSKTRLPIESLEFIKELSEDVWIRCPNPDEKDENCRKILTSIVTIFSNLYCKMVDMFDTNTKFDGSARYNAMVLLDQLKKSCILYLPMVRSRVLNVSPTRVEVIQESLKNILELAEAYKYNINIESEVQLLNKK